ncbi:MAG: primosomal protein N', partial [Brachybacterium tyrofermentans]
MRPGGGAQALTTSRTAAAGEPEEEQASLFAAPAVPVPEPAPSDPGRDTAARASGLRTTAGFAVVDELPVASVRLVGVLPHLDRPFEYAVTPDTAAAAAGMRVRVRFSGRDTEGIVLGRHEHASTDRALAPLHRLVSEDVVVPPPMMRVVEEVAARCAGTVGDVLRLALPPRHARAEKSDRAAAEKDAAQEVDPPETAPRDSAADEPAPDTPDTDEADEADGAAEADEAADTEGAAGTAAVPTEAPPEPRPGDRYPGLGALLSRAGSATGPVPRATITLDSADPWTTVTADALADLGPEQGALVIAPDRRDVDRLSRILTERGIGHEILAGTEGPEKRYRTFR